MLQCAPIFSEEPLLETVCDNHCAVVRAFVNKKVAFQGEVCRLKLRVQAAHPLGLAMSGQHCVLKRDVIAAQRLGARKLALRISRGNLR